MSFVRLLLILVLSTALATLPGCGKSDSRTNGEVVNLTGSPKVDLDRAYSIGDYKTAIPLLREVLNKNPGDGRNWFRLGYALHSENRLDEAIQAHGQAASLDSGQRATAFYNWGCALAMQGKKTEAIARLALAIEAGFDREQLMSEDEDLVSIRDEPEFTKLLEQIRTAASAAPGSSQQKDFNFWVGTWDLETEDGRNIARTSVEQKHNDFALIETWRIEGGRTGTTLTVYDHREECWKQTRVGNDGQVDYFTGKFDGESMRLTGEFVRRDGTHGLRNITITHNSSEQVVDQLVEESTDDGETWQVTFKGQWVPRKPQLAL